MKTDEEIEKEWDEIRQQIQIERRSPTYNYDTYNYDDHLVAVIRLYRLAEEQARAELIQELIQDVTSWGIENNYKKINKVLREVLRWLEKEVSESQVACAGANDTVVEEQDQSRHGMKAVIPKQELPANPTFKKPKCHIHNVEMKVYSSWKCPACNCKRRLK